MATPPDSPIEEVVYELEPSRVPKPIPVALEDLCRQTKFTRQEIRVMYRGFKSVSIFLIHFFEKLFSDYVNEVKILLFVFNLKGFSQMKHSFFSLCLN